jgi:hypothetical protein
VLTSGKVRCSPSSPCSRATARCAWLRVAPLLPIPSATRRGLGQRRSGRESRLADRTGKPVWITPRNAPEPALSIDKPMRRREHSGEAMLDPLGSIPG